MKKQKEVATLEQARAAAERVARAKGTPITDVTGAEVGAELGVGSEGYVFAHLQTVKVEYFSARCFQSRDMTDRLMAALQDELAGRERKTEERVRAESKVTQELFEEACSEINNTKARLAAMVDQLTALREDHATQLRARDDELTKVRDQASKLESRLEIAEKIRNEAILQFNSMQLNHGVIQERLTNTAEDLARAEKEIGTLRDCLKNAERDRDEARKTAADHDQRAILLTWQVDHKDEENAHLKKELAEASLRAANAEARLELLGSGGSKPEAKVGQKQQEGRARN